MGSLWTSSGSRLAQATFQNESASGWQTVTMPPVAVSAGATYVASVFMPQGHYARDASYFFDNAYEAWPLRALANGEEGGNGVFRYGGSGFPTATSSSANYWVDVVFDVTNNVAPTVVGTFPAAGLQSVSRTSPVEVTFSEVNSDSLVFEPRTAAGAVVPGITTYDAPTRTACVHGVGDAAGPGRPHRQGRVGPGFLGRLPHYAVLVELLTIGDPGTTPTSLWTPRPRRLRPGRGVRARRAFPIRGQRRDHGAALLPRPSGAQEVGHLWDSAGNLLSTVSFAPGSPSGWQQANLPASVAIQKNTTYVASYYSPRRPVPGSSGFYRRASTVLRSTHRRRPPPSATACSGTGRRASRSRRSTRATIGPTLCSGFRPTSLRRSSPTRGAPDLVAVTVSAPVRATFDGPINPASLHSPSRGTGGSAVTGAVTYDAETATASFTPPRRSRRTPCSRRRSGQRTLP